MMMKKHILVLCTILALVATVQAQSPQAFSYQALVRNAAGQALPSTEVTFRITLSAPASPDAPAYTELQQVTTDPFGQVALQIGQGERESGSFSALDWAQARYAIQVELDVQDGSGFLPLGSPDLLSVPYALHAQTVEQDKVEDADADPRNEIQYLRLAGDTLHVTDANYVLLPTTMAGNPESGGQTLSLANDTLAISDGNAVFMEDYLVGEMIEALEEGKLTLSHLYDNYRGIFADTISGVLSFVDSTLNLTQGGNAGLGTTNPKQKLRVVGGLRIEDGSEQDGAVLGCDAYGVATWINPASFDHQTLSLSGGTLSISDGNSVDLSNIEDSDFSLSHVNAGSNTKVLVIEGKQNGKSTYAQIEFKNTDSNTGGSGNSYNGARIAADNTDGSEDGDLRFSTYNGSITQQMIIDNEGAFGFGIDIPAYYVDIHQDRDGDFAARIKNTANSNSSADNGLLIQAGHNSYNSSNQSAFIEFKTTNGTFCGRIKQDGGSSVNYYDASDRRLKENIRPTRYGLQDLMKIQVRDYNYIADGPAQQRTGFIAQELHEVYPTAVDKGGEDVNTEPWSVAYGKLTPVLVQAVQDQRALIEAQQEELRVRSKKLLAQQAELEALRQAARQLQSLEARLRTLESSVSTEATLSSK